jgi:broad specificity phosphatase PhoE
MEAIPMSTLLLVRHGQASFFSSDYDRLSPLGEEQSRRLGRFWAERRFQVDAVFTGPRARQVRTATLAGEVCAEAGLIWPSATQIDELDEMQTEALLENALPALSSKNPEVQALLASFQAAQDRSQAAKSFQRLYERVVHAWVAGELDAGGVEPWVDFCARVQRGIAKLTSAEGSGRTILAFTSGGPIGAAMQLALGTSQETTVELSWMVRNAAISEFLFSGKRFTLSSFNAIPHLPDPTLWTYR